MLLSLLVANIIYLLQNAVIYQKEMYNAPPRERLKHHHSTEVLF